ncbi:hypothetical protein [Duganella sp. LjRoot269]|uniref:hypothetical protein n=1 Tax=Duganella sp. LjRoot269 TaxID=3342305 RepID=UPI003ECF1D8F
MAIITPPTIDPAPLPAAQRGDPDTFSDRVDSLVTWWETSPAQIGAVADNVAHNATEALNSATAADGSAAAAGAAAASATNSKNAAATSEANAHASELASAASATAAQAIQLVGTSSSSVLIGTGAKTYVTQAGKQWVANTPIQATDSTNAANFVNGTVSSYGGTSLVINSTLTGGSGTPTSWNISVVGAQGAQGPGNAAGNAAGAINELKGTAPASSATPDIWGAGGNYVSITSTTTVTGFPNAPQAGARRTLIAQADFSITNSSNLVVRGGTRVVLSGDEVEIVADTISTFHATIKRGSGRAVSSLLFTRAELLLTSGTFTAKITGPHRAYLQGPGGSGGIVSAASGSGVTVSATGGAAGGTAIKDFDAVAGAAYTFLAGAPGAAPTGNTSNGNAGSTSTFTGAGVSLSCNGGNGGTYSQSTTSVLLGATGGTASGGDFNYQGGGSGSCGINSQTGTGPSNTNVQATGGGSVSWQSVMYNSGNVSMTGTLTNPSQAASGGAGVGGNSGNVTLTAGTSAVSGGGGSRTASPSVTASTTTTGANGAGSPGLNITPINLIGDGAGASSGAGGGSAGSTSNGNNAAGNLAGTGGIACASSGASLVPGLPGWGAGSGGAAAFGAATVPGMAGGISFVIILY